MSDNSLDVNAIGNVRNLVQSSSYAFSIATLADWKTKIRDSYQKNEDIKNSKKYYAVHNGGNIIKHCNVIKANEKKHIPYTCTVTRESIRTLIETFCKYIMCIVTCALYVLPSTKYLEIYIYF